MARRSNDAGSCGNKRRTIAAGCLSGFRNPIQSRQRPPRYRVGASPDRTSWRTPRKPQAEGRDHESPERTATCFAVARGAACAGRAWLRGRAVVRNHAKLAYSSVGAWLEDRGEMPAALSAVPTLADNLRLQDRVAQCLKARRHERGALELETVEVRTEFDGGAVSRQVAEKRNRAKELIEDFMIAANGAIARFLEERRFPVLRRVVHSPERWQRIVEIAQAHGEIPPPAPDAKALNDFLRKQRSADPLRFADLSLSVFKLLGRIELFVEYQLSAQRQRLDLCVAIAAHGDYARATSVLKSPARRALLRPGRISRWSRRVSWQS